MHITFFYGTTWRILSTFFCCLLLRLSYVISIKHYIQLADVDNGIAHLAMNNSVMMIKENCIYVMCCYSSPPNTTIDIGFDEDAFSPLDLNYLVYDQRSSCIETKPSFWTSENHQTIARSSMNHTDRFVCNITSSTNPSIPAVTTFVYLQLAYPTKLSCNFSSLKSSYSHDTTQTFFTCSTTGGYPQSSLPNCTLNGSPINNSIVRKENTNILEQVTTIGYTVPVLAEHINATVQCKVVQLCRQHSCVAPDVYTDTKNTTISYTVKAKSGCNFTSQSVESRTNVTAICHSKSGIPTARHTCAWRLNGTHSVPLTIQSKYVNSELVNTRHRLQQHTANGNITIVCTVEQDGLADQYFVYTVVPDEPSIYVRDAGIFWWWWLLLLIILLLLLLALLLYLWCKKREDKPPLPAPVSV